MLSKTLYHLNESLRDIPYMGLSKDERESVEMKLNQAYKLIDEVYSKIPTRKEPTKDESNIVRSSN